MLTCSSNSRFTSGGAFDTVSAIAVNSSADNDSMFSAITATASIICSGVSATPSDATACSVVSISVGETGTVDVSVTVEEGTKGTGRSVTFEETVDGGVVATGLNTEVNVVDGP